MDKCPSTHRAGGDWCIIETGRTDTQCMRFVLAFAAVELSTAAVISTFMDYLQNNLDLSYSGGLA